MTTTSQTTGCPFHHATTDALAPSSSRALAPARVPGPRGLAWISMLFGLMWRPLKKLMSARARHGDVFRIGMGPMPAVFFVADPDAARHVLVTRAASYVKSRTYDGLKCFVGEGLLTNAGGEVWKRHRRLASPAFHRARFAALVTRMADATARTIERLGDRTEIEVHAEMTRLTLTIVGRTLFDVDLSSDGKLARAFDRAIRFANTYAISPVRIPVSWPTPWNLRFRRARAVLDAFVDRVITERRANPGDRGDLMSMLMAANQDDGSMDDRELRDEVMTMVGAGHETTASGMAWLLWLLARHPEQQERVRAEVRSVLGERRPEMADLERLPYTAMVVKEALRLHPPIWVIERTPLEDDEILGHRVPAGSIVAVSPYVLHRHTALWEEPDRFDPERFRPEAEAERERYAYLPFGAGPRVCIGARFASIEMQIITAMIVARFRLEPVPGREVVPEAMLTLRPRGGIRLRFERLVS